MAIPVLVPWRPGGVARSRGAGHRHHQSRLLSWQSADLRPSSSAARPSGKPGSISRRISNAWMPRRSRIASIVSPPVAITVSNPPPRSRSAASCAMPPQDRRRIIVAHKWCPQQSNARLLRNPIGLTMTAWICASDRNENVAAGPDGRHPRQPQPAQAALPAPPPCPESPPTNGLRFRQSLDLRIEFFLGRGIEDDDAPDGGRHKIDPAASVAPDEPDRDHRWSPTTGTPSTS